MIWVVNYNAVDCHIYSYDKQIPTLPLVHELKDPHNRGHKDPKEVEVEHFAKEVVNVLEQGRNNHSYSELVIIGPPHMNGLLFKHMNKNIKDMVSAEIQKDLQNITAKDLLTFLKSHLKDS